MFDIQLNFKLRWQSHMRQLQIKLITRTKSIQTLTKFTWETSMKTRREVYTTIFKSILTHETSAWYTSTTIKKHKKDVIRKLRFIQNQSLKIATRVYKAIATKTLKMKLHVFSIDLHMKKMMIKTMIRMNFKTSRNAIAKTINRIQRDLRDKRERRAKLRKTLATKKRIWLKRKLRKSDVTFIQSYTIFSWVCSSRVTIDNSDEIATRRHDVDKSNSKWKAYSNESEKDDKVTIVVVETNWKCVKRLKNIEITLIHHNEMKESIITMKRLVEKCAAKNECRNKVYKIYSNSRTSF